MPALLRAWPDLSRTGLRVAAIHKSRGLTQQQLAEQIEMSVVAIAYIETGKRWARLGTLTKIANAVSALVDVPERNFLE